MGRDFTNLHADDRANAIDHEDLVVDANHECSNDRALLLVDLDATNTLTAATLTIELVELRALSVATIGNDEYGCVVASDIAGHNFVANTHLHTANTRRSATHGTNFVFGESNGLTGL